MELAEKIDQELKNYLPARKTKLMETWTEGFRTGFRSGYNFAYEEATEMLKKRLWG